MYQGHLSDGSSVQKHSAGPIYPWIVYARDKGLGRGVWHEVMGPGIEGFVRFNTFDGAYKFAERCAVVARSEDAWCFELEQVCMLAGQRLRLADLVGVRQGPADYARMTTAARVAALLLLGRARNEYLGSYRLAFEPSPVFAAAARGWSITWLKNLQPRS